MSPASHAPIRGQLHREGHPRPVEPVWLFESGRLCTAVGTGGRATVEAWARHLLSPDTPPPRSPPESLVAVIEEGDELVISWQGDARAYHMGDQTLRLLTFEAVPFSPARPSPIGGRLRTLRVTLQGPGLIWLVTRGAWECWATDWLMERALLGAFERAPDWDAWAALVTQEIAAVARQSASFAAIPRPTAAYKRARKGLMGSRKRLCHRVHLDRPEAYQPTLLVSWEADTQPQLASAPAANGPPLARLAPKNSLRRTLIRAALAACLLLTAWGAARLHRLIEPPRPPEVTPTPTRLATLPRARPIPAPRAAPDAALHPLPGGPGVARLDAGRFAEDSARRPRALPAPRTTRAPAAAHPRPALTQSDRHPRRALRRTKESFRWRARVPVVVRAAPQRGAARIGLIPPGTAIESRARAYGSFWVRVQWRGQVGWIAPIRGYLTPQGGFSVWDVPPITRARSTTSAPAQPVRARRRSRRAASTRMALRGP